MKRIVFRVLSNVFSLCFFVASIQFSHNCLALDQKNGESVDVEDIDKMESLDREMRSIIQRIEVIEKSLSEIQSKISDNGNSMTKNDKILGNTNDSDIQTQPKTENTAVTTDTKNNDTTFENASSDTIKSEYNLALALFKEISSIKTLKERDKKLDEIQTKFSDFITKYPKSDMIANAYFWYGEVFFQKKDYDAAAIQYLKSYKIASKNTKIKNSKSMDALLKLSMSLGELKKTKQACDILNKLSDEFPKRTESILKREKDSRIKFGCK